MSTGSKKQNKRKENNLNKTLKNSVNPKFLYVFF